MTTIPKNRPFSDVPRLLQMRSEIKGKKIGQFETNAVTAFLAWRAFLIVARTATGGHEKNFCLKKIKATLEEHNELKEVTESFVNSLKQFTQQPEEVIKEWYSPPNDVTIIMREINDMNVECTKPGGWKKPWPLTEHLFAIRNCVLAHGTMHSTGNLFQSIMPAFDNFIASIACAGYATQSKITFNKAKEECHV